MLVAKYHDSNCTDKEILGAIDRAVKSSLELRSKKELIESFIKTVNAGTDVQNDWEKFVTAQREKDLEDLITGEKLKPEETRKYVNNAFRDGEMKTSGTDIDKIMPPISRFCGGGKREEKKQTIIDKLKAFFDKYFGLGLKAMDADKSGGDMTYVEPADYFPKDIRKKYKLGEYNTDDADTLMVAEDPVPYDKKE
jgi:type I restriction enzyme R subunit